MTDYPFHNQRPVKPKSNKFIFIILSTQFDSLRLAICAHSVCECVHLTNCRSQIVRTMSIGDENIWCPNMCAFGRLEFLLRSSCQGVPLSVSTPSVMHFVCRMCAADSKLGVVHTDDKRPFELPLSPSKRLLSKRPLRTDWPFGESGTVWKVPISTDVFLDFIIN